MANPHSGGAVLLGQSGREKLTNYQFVLEAPWKACRLCGTVYQCPADRLAYRSQQNGEHELAAQFNLIGKERRERWLEIHNRRKHPWIEDEIRMLELSGMPVTAEAAGKLSTYGIVPISPTPYEDEVAQALFEAPRCAVNDAEGT